MPKNKGQSASKAKKIIANSPAQKVKHNPPKKKVKKKPVGPPKISVVAFTDNDSFEAHMMEKGNGDEMYVYELKRYVRDQLDQPARDLDKLNFVKTCDRRIPNTKNATMKQGDGTSCSRSAFVRHPTDLENGHSTKESRQEGLRGLKDFFMDPKFHRYPPKDIVLVDLTDETNPASLDEYFCDDAIKELMEEDLDSADLNPQFATKWPEFARTRWKCDHISEWGLNSLGYAALLEKEKEEGKEET